MDTKVLGFILLSTLLLISLAYIEFNLGSFATPSASSSISQLQQQTGVSAQTSGKGVEQAGSSCGLSPSTNTLVREVEEDPSFITAEKGLNYLLVNAENETVATYANATGVPMGANNETVTANAKGNPGVLVSNVTYTYLEFAAFSGQVAACNGIPKSAIPQLEGILNVLVPITKSGSYNISAIEIHYQGGLP
jgi:hypothetical protein